LLGGKRLLSPKAAVKPGAAKAVPQERSNLPHTDDVAVWVFEKCATDAAGQRDDTFDLNTPVSQSGDLSFDIRDLECGHSSIDWRHRTLENRQPRSAATAIADRFRDLDLDLESQVFLIEAASALQVVYGQSRGYRCARKHFFIPLERRNVLVSSISAAAFHAKRRFSSKAVLLTSAAARRFPGRSYAAVGKCTEIRNLRLINLEGG
jgi:hypothetical protein